MIFAAWVVMIVFALGACGGAFGIADHFQGRRAAWAWGVTTALFFVVLYAAVEILFLRQIPDL